MSGFLSMHYFGLFDDALMSMYSRIVCMLRTDKVVTSGNSC